MWILSGGIMGTQLIYNDSVREQYEELLLIYRNKYSSAKYYLMSSPTKNHMDGVDYFESKVLELKIILKK